MNTSFGIVVTFEREGVAERSMYFGDASAIVGGHASVGVPRLSRTWHLAEGATGTFFDTFLLLLNPTIEDVEGWATFFTNGTPWTGTNLDAPLDSTDAQPRGAAAARQRGRLDARIRRSPDRRGAVPGTWPDGRWYEGHNSPGSVEAAGRWGLAEGSVGGDAAYQTFILVMNPQITAASVSITFFLDDGRRVVKTFTVPAQARVNVNVLGPGPDSDVPEIADTGFSALVLSDQAIVVERAMYSSATPGRPFAAGTVAAGTRLP